MKLWWRESDGQSPRFVDAIAKKKDSVFQEKVTLVIFIFVYNLFKLNCFIFIFSYFLFIRCFVTSYDIIVFKNFNFILPCCFSL